MDVLIPVGKDLFAIVDAEDAEKVGRYSWRMRRGCPIAPTFRKDSKEKKQHTIPIANVVMGRPPEGKVWDHIDRNPLNNRRSNLRPATNSQNQANARGRRGSSRYKGVSWMKARQKWLVHFQHEGEYHFVGYFTDEREAALAYNEAARRVQGEFAYLNELE